MTKLSSEQQRALKVLKENLETWYSLLDLPLLPNCTQTNFFTFSTHPIRREFLPHEDHWVWNQSNAKTTTKILNEKVSVTIQKFNARKKPKSNIRQPSYKLWIFTLEQFINETLYGLWCEKGKDLGGQPQYVSTRRSKPDIGPIIKPEELRLESFGFLREFVSEENAIEFGWTQPKQTQQNNNVQNMQLFDDFNIFHDETPQMNNACDSMTGKLTFY